MQPRYEAEFLNRRDAEGAEKNQGCLLPFRWNLYASAVMLSSSSA